MGKTNKNMFKNFSRFFAEGAIIFISSMHLLQIVFKLYYPSVINLTLYIKKYHIDFEQSRCKHI